VLVAAITTASALGFAGGARSDSLALTAVVGTNDGYDISLTDDTGAAVKTLAPGTYTVVVHDRSILHNFRIVGPGVDMATSVLGAGDFTWTVTLTDGYYRYFCDPHVPEMHGDFVVGSGARPLTATVLAGKAPVVRDAFGLLVTSSVAGRFALTVRDLARSENFRLSGPGVNRATAIPYRGTVRWVLTLAPGRYTYRSDAHPNLRRALSLRAA
jgi:plastocyanin